MVGTVGAVGSTVGIRGSTQRVGGRGLEPHEVTSEPIPLWGAGVREPAEAHRSRGDLSQLRGNHPKRAVSGRPLRIRYLGDSHTAATHLDSPQDPRTKSTPIDA